MEFSYLLNQAKTDENSYLQIMKQKYSPDVAEGVRKFIERCEEIGLEIKISGKSDISCSPVLLHKGVDIKIVMIWTSGTIYLPFDYNKNKPFFDNKLKRDELVARMKAIPVIFDSSKPKPGTIISNPKIHLGFIKDNDRLQKFLQIIDWVVSEIKIL